MIRDSADTDPSILETRYRAKRNQSTLNIELGITGNQNTGSASQGGGGGGTVGGSPVIGVITGGGGSGSSGACFSGRTHVLMSNLQTMPIWQVSLGNYVKAPDEDGILQDGRVVGKFEHEVMEFLFVEFADGRITETTEAHKYFDGEIYRPVINLDSVRHLSETMDWVDCKINTMRPTTLKYPKKVYNLEIEIFHSYVANGDWVSNAKAPPE